MTIRGKKKIREKVIRVFHFSHYSRKQDYVFKVNGWLFNHLGRMIPINENSFTQRKYGLQNSEVEFSLGEKMTKNHN